MEVLINCIEDLEKYSHLIPVTVKKDVNKRINDWISSGGSLSDYYIKRQLKYVELVISIRSERK